MSFVFIIVKEKLSFLLQSKNEGLSLNGDKNDLQRRNLSQAKKRRKIRQKKRHQSESAFLMLIVIKQFLCFIFGLNRKSSVKRFYFSF